MAILKFENIEVTANDETTVLDALLEAGADIPFGCRAGACHACMLQVVEGSVPDQAKAGLKAAQKEQDYFLSCQCKATSDLVIKNPLDAYHSCDATVASVEELGGGIIRLRLESDMEYRPGQYLTLWKDKTTGRCYSLASVPDLGEPLELHIKAIKDGKVSGWIKDDVKVGDALTLNGPLGECFYACDDPQQSLLLVGISTGLAPLYGIVRDALNRNHTGEIHLVAGALDASGLYLVDELKQIARQHDNFHYHPVVLQGPTEDPDINCVPIDKYVMSTFSKLSGWNAYICGDAEIVNKLKKIAFLSGVSLADIYSDPFLATG